MYILGMCRHSSFFEYQLERIEDSIHKKEELQSTREHAGMLTAVFVQI